MSNDKIFFINLDFESSERYDLAKFMEFTDNYDPLTSTVLNYIKSIPKQGDLIVTSEEGRPDLVSYNYYGVDTYWAAILLYNDRFTVDDIKINDRLSMPSIAGLEDLYFSLKSKQSASEKV